MLNAIGFAIFFGFSVPLVFCVGFPSLWMSLRLQYGPLFVPPIAGSMSGLLIAKLMYVQGTIGPELIQFTLMGLTTAVVAALMYFRPWGTTVVA
jgi:hypothetical protein